MDVITALVAQADQPDSSWPFLFAVVAGTVVLLYFTRRRSVRKDTPLRTYARQQRAEFSTRHGVETELREVMIELESLAREVNAQIDTKYHKLEAVMRDADQRIARLERLLDSEKPDTQERSELDVTIGDAPPTDSSPPLAEKHARIDRRIVHQLADTGKTPLEIARQLGQPTGEIELILALRSPQVSDKA